MSPLTDYSDLEKEIQESPEPKILPRGTEVKARIIAIRDGVSEKNDCTWYTPVFDVPNSPEVMEFSDFFWDLADAKFKVEPKQYARSLTKFKNFAAAFDIDYSRPFDWEDFIGLEGWLIVGVRKSDEYGDQNTVSKYSSGPKGARPAGTGSSLPKASTDEDEIPF